MLFELLKASESLTKQFSKTVTGEIQKTPYPMTWEFTSITENCTTLHQLEAVLNKHALLGHCLLKGKLGHPLTKESRAGSTSTNDATEWMVLDLDGLPELIAGNPLGSIDQFMDLLGFKDVSYIIQWSASYGIYDTLLRAHIFVLLDKPYAAPLLKQWLIQQNHSIIQLSSNLELTKTGNALSWPLDISACQNDKLIYIAPPVLKKVKDPLHAMRLARIKLVSRPKQVATISINTHAAAVNKDLTAKKIEDLRAAAGLPKRKLTYKMHGSVEILAKPDACTITELRQERGFVYFNLNGGDSWAYYHPENNPDFIFNFKGEPTYLTKELLPDYYQQLTDKGYQTSTSGISYLAFCDNKTSAYYIGKYDQAQDHLELNIARSAVQLRDFAKQFGIPLGDYIPTWDLVFDPHDNVRVDFQNKTVNQFSPSIYMRGNVSKVTVVPKTILKVITHALGDDPEIVEHFLNWIAFILQERDRTGTAWVLHGVPGTGKGILCNNILRPIFGAAHTAARRMEELNEQYNHFMKAAFLVFVDEVQTKALQNERGVMAKLKNFITEIFVTVRSMYSNGVEIRNYTNWIFNSNMPDPVLIEQHDRRMNVAKYQKNKLIITDAEIAQIEKELQAFHNYLQYYKVDKAKAMTVMETDDRATMISISESSIDTVSSALLNGSFEFFMDQLPAGSFSPRDFVYAGRLENYKTVLRALLARSNATGACSIAREELHVMYDFVIGQMPSTPNKFTSLLKHHRVHIIKVWLDGKAVSGVKAQWQDIAKFPTYSTTLSPQPPQLQVVGGGKKK